MAEHPEVATNNIANAFIVDILVIRISDVSLRACVCGFKLSLDCGRQTNVTDLLVLETLLATMNIYQQV
jgi:hypothetical protein